MGLVISTFLIYIVTKLMGEKEGFKTAFFAALLGSVMFGIVAYILGNGAIAAVYWWYYMVNITQVAL